MSWTTSYPIPIRRKTTGIQKTWPLSVKIDNELWIFCHTVYTDPFETQIELFIFQTETYTMKKVEITDESPVNAGMAWFTENNDEQIYIWKKGRDDMVLCKFDVTTRVISHVLTFFNNGLSEYTPIIGDIMYALFHDEDEKELTLKVINLSTKKVIRDVHLMSTENKTFHYRLVVNDGKLYVLEYDNKVGIKIHVFEDELKVLSIHMFDDTVGEIEIHTGEEDVYYTLPQPDATIDYCYDYNFDTLKWEEKIYFPIPTEFKKLQRVTSEHFDGLFYSIVVRPLSNSSKLDVKCFEYEPKLSTVCYLNIVNELMKTEDLVELERIEQLLPNELRLQLSNMIKWRLEEKKDEHQKKLEDEQREKVMGTLTEMMGDGTIDEELLDIFKKIFAPDKNGRNEEQEGADDEENEEEAEDEEDDEEDEEDEPADEGEYEGEEDEQEVDEEVEEVEEDENEETEDEGNEDEENEKVKNDKE